MEVRHTKKTCKRRISVKAGQYTKQVNVLLVRTFVILLSSLPLRRMPRYSPP